MDADPTTPATDPLAELIKGAHSITFTQADGTDLTFGCLCTLGADHAEPVEGEPAAVDFERAVRAEATRRYRRPRMQVGTASDREEVAFVEGAMWAPALPSRQVVAEAIDPVAFSDWSGAHDPRDQEQQQRRRQDAYLAADRVLAATAQPPGGKP